MGPRRGGIRGSLAGQHDYYPGLHSPTYFGSILFFFINGDVIVSKIQIK